MRARLVSGLLLAMVVAGAVQAAAPPRPEADLKAGQGPPARQNPVGLMAAAGEGSTRELGLLASVQAEARVIVPKDGLWQAPESSFVSADSISVQPQHGPPLVRRDREPRLGQFSCQPGGVIVFNAADAGRPFLVRYQFQPRRVVLLDAASPTENAGAQSLLQKALAEELSKHGFVVVPAPEVREATATLALEAASPHAPPPPEKLAALAQRANAAYVLVPGVGIKEHRTPGEFDTGIPIPRDKSDRSPEPFYEIPGDEVERSARPLLEEEPTLLLPISRSRLYGAVRLVVVDGVTGTVVGDEMTSAFQRVRVHRFSPARASLVRRLAAQAVAAWREPAR